MPRPARPSQVATLAAELGDPEPGASWRLDGRCAEIGDPELWFPEQGGDTNAARDVCNTCEVRLRCLEYAIQRPETDGVWGGTTYEERLRIDRLRRGDPFHRRSGHLAGRRPLLTDDRQAKALALLIDGATIQAAADAMGVSHDTVKRMWARHRRQEVAA